MSDLIKFSHKRELAPEILFAEANRKLNNSENLEEIIDMLYSIAKNYPNFGKTYNHLGWIFETKFRDYVKAEENYKKALELSPEYPAIYENYASILERLRKLDELKNILDLGLANPSVNKAAMHEYYGRYYELNGEYDLAISEFRKSIGESFSGPIISDLQDCIKRCQQKKTILRVDE